VKSNIIFILSIVVLFSCTNSKPSDNDVETKALELVKTIDTNTLSFLKTWNYTNRMNYFNIWTKVKDIDSLEYSFLYETISDTTYIEIYDVANFLKDYKTTFKFDTTAIQFYRLAKVNNNVISIYRDGRISESKNLIINPIPIDSLFSEANPFAELEKINHYKDKFNFSYCIYTPSKGNYIRFAYANSNENILYYIPNDLVIHDKALFSWIDKFSKGKRLGNNWILVNKDNLD